MIRNRCCGRMVRSIGIWGTATFWLQLSSVSALESEQAANPSVSDTGMDIMVVADMSGSMKGDASLTYRALFEWVERFAHPKDRIGVVTFGTKAREILPLTDADTFSFEVLKPNLKQRDSFSDVAGGLENAFYRLKTDSPQGTLKVIVLFSDAKIDLPGDGWESRNSMRYLIESLFPALKADNVRLIAVVPDGLTADFQLLQELTSGTGGVYYRGIPDDVTRTRSTVLSGDNPIPVSTSITTQAPAGPNIQIETPVQRAPVLESPRTSSQGETKGGSGVVIERVVHEGSASWMIALFIVFGIALLGMSGVVLFLVISRNKRRDMTEDDNELESVLLEVHSLKQMAAEKSLSSAAAAAAFEDESEEFFANAKSEPSEDLSVGFVAPFLEFEAKKKSPAAPTDDIAVTPGFSTSEPTEDDSNMSLSNMETLLGMAGVDGEQKRD